MAVEELVPENYDFKFDMAYPPFIKRISGGGGKQLAVEIGLSSGGGADDCDERPDTGMLYPRG